MPIRDLRYILVSVLAGSLFGHSALAADLTELSIEELLSIEVFTAGKKTQQLFEIPAATYILTGDEIRRSGATTIPEVLRLVPGMHIGRADASKWGVTARGFNNRFANKLLVLVDGRSVYNTLFAGIVWETLDFMLEDIDRIEVIRGPGAALWGANAVNGVINIITKSAEDTQEGITSLGGGTKERGFGAIRYGNPIGDHAFYRFYAKTFYRSAFVDSANVKANDDWHMARVGFRIDQTAAPNDALTVSGDLYGGTLSQTMVESASFTPPHNRVFDFDTEAYGGHILGRWSRQFSNTARMRLGLYYDISRRKDVVFDDLRHTIDIDFQHQFMPWERHDIVWGFGYRWSRDRLRDTDQFSWRKERRSIQILSTFVQDDWTLIQNCLRLILGAKFENNDFTGIETQPSARLFWTVNRQHAIWGALSRAVRLPTRGETDGRVLELIEPLGEAPNSPLAVVRFYGSETFQSENLMAFELGYRMRPSNRFSIDIAGYYNVYDNLLSGEPQDPIIDTTTMPAQVLVVLLADNKANARTWGAEIAADWMPASRWQWRAAYTYLHMDLTNDPDSKAQFTEDAEGESPKHQVVIRSLWDVSDKIELDTTWRYVDALPFDVVDAYLTLDVRLGWRINTRLSLDLVGQNLLDDHRREFDPELIDTLPTDTQRSAYANLKWIF